MNIFKSLGSNYIINVGFTAFLLAQLLKTLFTLIMTKKLVLERLLGAGGMPSSHSAMTMSIAIAMALKTGFSSPEFGLALAFAVIVMYDAMGVRRAAGEQAKLLNRIVFEIPWFSFAKKRPKDEDEDRRDILAKEDDEQEEEIVVPLLDKELKEFLGHTPLEVLGGCLLGILVALFMPMV